MISTKGRYALRILIDLAEHSNGSYIPMKTVADRQNLSLKYIERILPILARNRIIEGVHGKGGGYRLVRDPEDYTVWEILTLMEGSLAPVACVEGETNDCERAPICRTLNMWKEYYSLTKEYFSGITIADLMKKDSNFGEYII